MVELTDVAAKRIGGFSGGMKQRLLIAQAILGKPEMSSWTNRQLDSTQNSASESAVSFSPWPRTKS
ncbi:MAG: hypothetical protein ACLTXL_01035 [Clostridia bacterium]